MTERIRIILSCIKNQLSPYFLLLLVFIISTIPVNSKVFFLEAEYYQDSTRERKITLGKGEIVSSDNPVSRVAVSDPDVVDLQVLNEKQVFVRAKKLGIATILVWEKSKSIPTRFDVSVFPDIQYLTKQLHALDPNINIEFIPPSNTLDSGNASSQSEEPQGEGAASPSSLSNLPSAGVSSSSSSSSSQISTGKIVLSGEVDNAEIIARALQIAGAYVGDQGIKIISQPGGQVVDGLAGTYNLNNNSSSQAGQTAQGSATAFGARDPISFTSNRYANLSRGVIATTQRGSVLSFLTVKDPPQISVAIRFYEISRNVARNLGFNATFGGSTLQGGSFIGGNVLSQITGGIASNANLGSFMAGESGMAAEFGLAHGSIASGSFLAQAIGEGVTGVIFNPGNGIGAIIQALQVRGEIKTLAEPNLVISNGEPASFLAGGEVPIVRSVFTAGGASQDVTYEPFGIKFSILPVVTSNDRIYLQLIPEIRDIDTELSNLVAPPGSTAVRPPAFRTRRTQTQVELESGQAFAISGLLREDNTRNLRKVPGIGDIPILGTLFRSKSFRKDESELLIVVSPQIVRPTKPDKIAKLTRTEVPYHDFDQLPPRNPFIQKDDEKGPDMKEPLNPNKYNEPQENNNEGQKEGYIPNKLPVHTAKLFSTAPQEITTVNEKLRTEIKKVYEKQRTRNHLKSENNIVNKTKQPIISRLIPQIQNKNLSPEQLDMKQQMLKEKWNQEVVKYAQAKEAMKLARENN